MRHAYLEPSAWVKRYYREAGTELTNALFAELLGPRPSRLLCSRAGIAEVVSVLNRHRNAGRVTQSLFNAAYAHFEAESRRVRLLRAWSVSRTGESTLDSPTPLLRLPTKSTSSLR